MISTSRYLSLLSAVVLACSACVPRGPTPVSPGDLRSLGESPLCEASAARWSPWDPNVVLVADNEIDDRLFRFRLDDTGLLVGDGSLALIGGGLPEDLEALAAVDGKLVAVGSHGRGGGCRTYPGRRRLVLLTPAAGGADLEVVGRVDSADRWTAVTADEVSCLAGLFVQPIPALARELCRAVVTRERLASAERCVAFDVEGAVTLPDDGGRDRLWLGLRQPRIDGGAVLVRLAAELDELRFDGVAVVTEPRGIRSLEAHAGFLWAVLGPEAPSFDASILWRAPLTVVVPGAVLDGEVVAGGLPPSSEALVFHRRGLSVLVDGGSGPDPERCRQPSHQLVVDLPSP